MKTTYTNKLTVTVLLASFAFLSLTASAGQDGNQRLMIEKVIKLQQQAKAAEAVKQQMASIKAEECKKQIEQGKNATGN